MRIMSGIRTHLATRAHRPHGVTRSLRKGVQASTVAATAIGGRVATKKQKARAAAAGKEPSGKPKPKKKTSRGK
jgi:hypothetical protein